MLKKIIGTVMSLCLIISVCIVTVNASPEKVPSDFIKREEESMPQRDGVVPEGVENAENFVPPENISDFTPAENNEEGVGEQNITENASQTESRQMTNPGREFNGQMPNGMGGFPGNMQGFNQEMQTEEKMGLLEFIKTNATPITSLILLALAFIFVIFYRRKNY